MLKLSPLNTSDFKHLLEPMRHQREIFESSKDLPHYGLWWEMGTGKSKPIIDTYTWLFLKREIDGVIIISDKGAYLNWNINEIPKHMVNSIPHRISVWTSSKQVPDLVGMDDCLDILIMNVEAFSSERAIEHALRFTKSHYTLCIVDEATSIKNIKSVRTQNICKLGRACDYRRVATGTPITQSPLDLFGQCEFLQPGLLGHRTFVGFRNEYAEMRQMTFGSRSFQTIVGYRNLDKLTRKIQPFSSRVLKKDCLDLPDKIYEVVYVEHTPEQRKLYDDLKTYAMSQFTQGLLTVTEAITTVNKLHQINCGHVKLDDGTVVDISNNRISALMELLEKVPGKSLIWCAFQRDVELIMEAIDGRYKQEYAVHYYGRTSTSDRECALDAIAKDPKCRWFVGTAATGGKGLTLTSATTSIYYSNSDSAEDRWQSEDRNHRKGQFCQVTYHDFVTPGTVDVKILQRLKAKQNLSYKVLDEIRDLMAG